MWIKMHLMTIVDRHFGENDGIGLGLSRVGPTFLGNIWFKMQHGTEKEAYVVEPRIEVQSDVGLLAHLSHLKVDGESEKIQFESLPP